MSKQMQTFDFVFALQTVTIFSLSSKPDVSKEACGKR